MTALTVSIVAPHGCGKAATLVRELCQMLTPRDEVFIIEVNAESCDVATTEVTDEFRDGQQPIRHVFGGTSNEMVLRRLACTQAHHDVVVVIEDHTLPTQAALEAARSLAQTGNPFVTYYLRNGSSKTLVSRAFYRFIHSAADVSRWPEPPAVVPSVFAVNKPALEILIDGPVDQLSAGELELELLPQTSAASRAPSSADMVVEHHQEIGLRVAAVAVHSNARVVASTPVPHVRTGNRGNRFRSVWKSTHPKNVPERAVLLLLLASSLAGTAAGRLVGPGSAPEHLAHSHPHVHEFTYSTRP